MKTFKMFFVIFIVFLLGICFVPYSFADDMSDFYAAAKKISNGSPAWSQQDFIIKIQEACKSQKVEPTNKNNRILNPYIYENYGLVVYGLPYGKFYKTSKGLTFDASGNQGEFQFLGYAYENFEITNDFWHNDSWNGTGKFTTYHEVSYKDIPGAEASWKGLIPAQEEYLLNSKFYDDDYVIPGYTPFTLRDVFYNNIAAIKKKVLVQVPPTLLKKASVKLVY